MGRAKKDGKFVNLYMDKEVYDAVQKLSDETSLPKTAIIEKSIREYIRMMENKREETKVDYIIQLETANEPIVLEARVKNEGK